jgi:NRAMP (natural resistance-associated macrophage protein)-like metal ion transporter
MNKTSSFLGFFKKLGPGLITGASDDDPSGIATYTQAGSQFGLALLWTALFTFPLMVVIQEMCARIGIVTASGLTANIKKHYPKPVLWLIILLSAPAIILNIAADIAGMGGVANLIFPQIPSIIFSIFFIIILLLMMIFFSYTKMASILKYTCITLLLYLIIPFLIKQPWLEVAKSTFVPHFEFNVKYMSILVAILGTTISPYLFFWQATMEAEAHKSYVYVRRRALTDMKQDVTVGMFAANLVMYFIILTAGSVLFAHGITDVDTLDKAAKALEPLAGKFAYILFALGIIGTGFLAIPVLCGSLAYILSTAFNLKSGLDRSFYKAKGFYGIIILSTILGLGINYMGLSPVKLLLWTAILYGLSAPILIAIILHITNNKKVMGQHVNKTLSNFLGICTFVLMSLAAILLLYTLFL